MIRRADCMEAGASMRSICYWKVEFHAIDERESLQVGGVLLDIGQSRTEHFCTSVLAPVCLLCQGSECSRIVGVRSTSWPCQTHDRMKGEETHEAKAR